LASPSISEDRPERVLRLQLEYDGTAFSGWQANPGVRTVYGELLAALKTMTSESEPRLFGASRTDAGVHALGQVASFHTRTRIPPEGFLRGLNTLLPPDLCVRDCREAPLDFHARHFSEGKRYRYRILVDPVRSALLHRSCWHLRGPVDVDAMRGAAACLVGEHDFTSFRASGCSAASPVKRLDAFALRWSEPLRQIEIEVLGSAFLKYMVRNIVGSLVQVGLGRRPEGWLGEVLRARDRKLAGPTAPPGGLTLVEVFYDASELRRAAASAAGLVPTPPLP